MTDNREMEEKLAILKARFRARLTDNLKEVQKLSKIDGFEKLIEISHKLAGTAGTYGYAELSAQMRLLEQDLLQFKKEGTKAGPLDIYCQRAQNTLQKALDEN